MFEEDEEVTEVTETTETDTTNTPDTTSTVEAEVSAETDAVTSADAEVIDPYDWNGELDSLNKADWFTSLEEKTRNAFTAGYGRKEKNLTSDYTKKTTDLAGERKTFEALEPTLRKELDELKVQLATYKQWLDTGIEPSAEIKKDLKAKVAELTALQLTIEEMKTNRQTGEEELRASLSKDAKKVLDNMKAERKAVQQQLDTYIEQHNTTLIDQLETWVDTNASELWATNNSAALSMFAALLENGTASSPEMAIKMVGVIHDKFNQNKPEPIPTDIAVANGTSNITDTTDNRELSYAELKRKAWSSIRS